MRCSRFLLCISVAVALSTTARAADEKVNFDDHVLPILRAKCGTCHSAGEAKGGLVLDNFTAAMAGGASGSVIEPGELEDSRLWLLVTHKEQPQMPPKEKLPDETLAVIKKWIDGGALENKTSVPKMKKPKANMAIQEVTGDKPDGPPAMPEGIWADPLVLSARGNAVTALATSPWAPLAAVAGHHQVLLYDLQDFTLAGVLPFPEGTVNVLRFSRNGSLLMAAGGRGGQSGKAIVFDVKTGKRVAEVGAEFDAVLAADISPNHRFIALGGPKKLVRVYSTQDGELQYELKKHTDWITSIEYSPDGVLLATGDRSNGLFVWEADTGREFYNLTGHTGTITGVSWRADGNLLASISEDTTAKQWEMTNGSQVKNWGTHGGGGASIQFLRDGRMVTTGRDQVTKLWDQNAAQQRAFPAFGDLGLKVAYNEPTGLVLGGDWAGRVRVWNAADGVERSMLVTNPAALAVRLEEATKAQAAADAAAAQAAATVAAQEKAIADKKTAAQTAAKAYTDGDAAAKAAEAAKVEADKAVVAQTEAMKAADAALVAANAALDKAKAAKEAAEKAEDKKDVPAATEAFVNAEKAAVAAKAAAEKATADKAAADKVAVDAAAKAKATLDQVAALKVASDKATAEAVLTPEIQKALADAMAAAKAAADVAAAKKAVVAKLTLQKAIPAPQAPQQVAAP